MKQPSQRHGFTLVELLVVIGIIALLISMLLPALNKARVAAVQTQCLSNHKQVMMALIMYANENGGWGPKDTRNIIVPSEGSNAGWQVHWYHNQYLGKFLGNRSINNQRDNTGDVYYCPAYVRDENRPNIGIGLNWRYGAGICRWDGTFSQQKYTKIRRPAQVMIFADVYSGYRWEKFFYKDTGGTGLGSTNQGMVAYRHGKNTVVSFADGHAETFQNPTPNEVTSEAGSQYKGLHRAYLDRQIFFKYTGSP